MNIKPMHFTLSVGLIIRCGMTTLEFTRQISDDECQFEDTSTRRARTITKTELFLGISSEKYQVVSTSEGYVDSSSKDEEEVFIDLSTLKQSNKEKLDRRLMYVKAMQRKRITRGQRRYIHTEIKRVASQRNEQPPSVSSVMSWMRNYEKSGANIYALVSKNSAVKRAKRVSEEMEKVIFETLQKEYFTRDKNTITHAYVRFVAACKRKKASGELRADERIPSMNTLVSRINAVDLFQRIKSREGIKRAEMVCRTTLPGKRATYPLQRVEVDHTPMNWVILCERTGLPLGRPTLSLMIDSYSGYVLGMYVSFNGPGLSSVAGLIKDSLHQKEAMTQAAGTKNQWLSYGLPDELVIDNGLEFHSDGFKTMAREIGADLTFCKVRTPYIKAKVERFFYNLDFISQPKGRVRKSKPNEIRFDPYRDASITFENFIYGLVKYIVDVYHMTPNSKTLYTPHQLFTEGLERCPPAKYLTKFNEINLYAAMSKRLTFSSGGIRMSGLTYASYEFADLAKELGTGYKVDVRWDPDSIAQVYVRHPNTNKWIVAKCTDQRYAENLTWNQHLLIRLHAREKRKESGADLDLLATRSELHDYFESATRKPKRAESLAAARFAGYSSNNLNPKQFQKPQEDSLLPQTSTAGEVTNVATDAQDMNHLLGTISSQENVELFEEVEVFETVVLADIRNEVGQYAFGRKLH